MKIHFPRSVAGRLYSLVAFFTLCLAALLGYQLHVLQGRMVMSEQQQAKSVVEAAQHIVASFAQRVSSGEMTTEEAQAAAKSTLRAMRYKNGNYVYIYASDGTTVLLPTKPKAEGVNRINDRDANGKYHVRALIDRGMSSPEGGFEDYVFLSPDGRTYLAKQSYVREFAPWKWVLGSGVLYDDMNAAFRKTALTSSSVALVLILAAIALSLIIARSLAVPIRALNSQMEVIAAGDLSSEINGVDRKDEIGDMCRAVAVFRDNAIERQRLQEETAGNQAQREQRQQRIEQLIAAFHAEMKVALEAVGGSSGEMNGSAGTLKSIAVRTEENATGAASAAEQATRNVQTVASAAEELAASIGEINRRAAQTSELVSRASESAKRSNSKVRSLDEAAQKIGEVVGLIQAIAEQTNLLALNATIEAARAGDAGRGFAVVASEVKELATQTAKATEDISGHVGAIQSSTRETVMAIEEIATTMQDVSGFTQAIAEAVEQQGIATQEISSNVQEAATGTQIATDNMTHVTMSATETAQTAEVVLKVSTEVASHTEALGRSIQDFLSNVSAA